MIYIVWFHAVTRWCPRYLVASHTIGVDFRLLM